MKALMGQLKAEMIRTLRNRRYLYFSIIMPVLFYIIFVKQVGGNIKVGGADWNAYYLMSMTTFGVIGGALTTVAVNLANERKQGWVGLLRTTPLPSSAYLVSKMAAQMVLNLFVIIVQFVIGIAVEHVDLSIGTWMACGLWIWIGSLAFMAIGVFIGTVANGQVAQVISTGAQMVLAMLGGLWTPMQFLPKTMQTIAQWLPTYHFGHVPWELVAGRLMGWKDVAVLVAYALVFMVLSFWMSKRQEAVTA